MLLVCFAESSSSPLSALLLVIIHKLRYVILILNCAQLNILDYTSEAQLRNFYQSLTAHEAANTVSAFLIYTS